MVLVVHHGPSDTYLQDINVALSQRWSMSRVTPHMRLADRSSADRVHELDY